MTCRLLPTPEAVYYFARLRALLLRFGGVKLEVLRFSSAKKERIRPPCFVLTKNGKGGRRFATLKELDAYLRSLSRQAIRRSRLLREVRQRRSQRLKGQA